MPLLASIDPKFDVTHTSENYVKAEIQGIAGLCGLRLTKNYKDEDPCSVSRPPVDDTLFILNGCARDNEKRYLICRILQMQVPDIVGPSCKKERRHLRRGAFSAPNRSVIRKGCTRQSTDGDGVDVPRGVSKQAYKAVFARRHGLACVISRIGGQGLPYTLHTAVSRVHEISAKLVG